jgi:hypothetical protein
MEHEWKQPKNRSISTQFTSQLDDFQIAQSMAGGADDNEIAALQRMQDEFNRQDEMALAEQEAFARRVQDLRNAAFAASSRLDWLSPRRPFPSFPTSTFDQVDLRKLPPPSRGGMPGNGLHHHWTREMMMMSHSLQRWRTTSIPVLLWSRPR